MQLEFLAPLEERWGRVSKGAFIGWLVFYALFLLYQAKSPSGVITDLVFVPIHEGGHLLFRWFGQWLAVLGGTMLQLGVPVALAVYFVFQRQLTATAFCVFFFFQQFLPTAIYMADSRSQALQYVTVGEGEATHDWFFVFSNIGLLEHDTQIGAFVRVLGWLGMLGTIGWYAYRSWASQQV